MLYCELPFAFAYSANKNHYVKTSELTLLLIWLKMETDLELCEFYNTFFRECLKSKKNSKIKYFEKYLKLQLKNTDCEAVPSSETENHYYEPFAYIFKNNIYVSGIVATLFRRLFDKNTNLLCSLLGQYVIHVCCFSDGSCAEVVSIVQVLAKVSENISSQLRFNVTILCPSKNWKRMSLKVLSFLEKYKLYKEQLQFIAINLSEELPNEVQQVIKSADIVTMVNFFSKIENYPRIFSEIYTNILLHVKQDSIIFFMDSAYHNFFNGVCRHLPSCHFRRLDYKRYYKPLLNMEIIKNNFKPFDNSFENYFFVTLQKVSFEFWIKVEQGDRKRHALNLWNVPVKKDKSVEEIAINNTYLHLNSSKKCNARKSELGSNITEPATSRNYKHNSDMLNSFETKPQLCSDLPSSIENNVSHEVRRVPKKKTETNLKKVETKKTDMNNGNHISISEQLIRGIKQWEEGCKEKCKLQPILQRKKENNVHQPKLNKTVSDLVEKVCEKTIKLLNQRFGVNLEDCQNYSLTTSKSSQLQKIDSKEKKVFECQEKSMTFSQKNYVPQTNSNIDNGSYDVKTASLGWAKYDAARQRDGSMKEKLHVVSSPKIKALRKKERKVVTNKTEFNNLILSRELVEIGSNINNSNFIITSEHGDGDEVNVYTDYGLTNPNTFRSFSEKSEFSEICIDKNLSKASATKKGILNLKVDQKQVFLNQPNEKLTANGIYSKMSSTSTAEQTDLTESKQAFKFKTVAKNERNWYKKEIIGPKSSSETHTRFFDSDNQIMKSAENEIEKTFIPGETKVNPEEEHDSFNYEWKSPKTFIRKQLDEPASEDNFKIIPMINKSACFPICVERNLARLWEAADQEAVENEIELNTGIKSILKSIFAATKVQDCGIKQKSLEDISIQLTFLKEEENSNELQQNEFADLNTLNFSQFLQKKAKEAVAPLPQRKGKKKKAAKKGRVVLFVNGSKFQQQKGKKKKKKNNSKRYYIPHPETNRWDFTSEDPSIISLSADYANRLLKKVNLIKREDVMKQASEGENFKPVRIKFAALMCNYNNNNYDEKKKENKVMDRYYHLDGFFPVFNLSKSKDKRRDIWWRNCYEV